MDRRTEGGRVWGRAGSWSCAASSGAVPLRNISRWSGHPGYRGPLRSHPRDGKWCPPPTQGAVRVLSDGMPSGHDRVTRRSGVVPGPTYHPASIAQTVEAGPAIRSETALTHDWWMVLDRANERIVYRSTSPLEAFRLARRSAGGAVRLVPAPGFGISVSGRRGTVTVIRVPRNLETRRPRVAIPIQPMDRGEPVVLPDGSRFTWVPAEVAAREEPPVAAPVKPRRTGTSTRSRTAR